MGQRHHHVHGKAVPRKGALHLSIQLPLDDQRKEPRAEAEAGSPDAAGFTPLIADIELIRGVQVRGRVIDTTEHEVLRRLRGLA